MLNWIKNNRTFLILLLLGVIVRLFFIHERGLSHDELSAWERTRFTTWNDFWWYGIEYGDMHPPFYQVLLFAWLKIFGSSQWAIQSLSLVFYLLNMSLMYKIGKTYFSVHTAYWIILFYLAFSFPIYGTVFSRPYNSGFFFLLLFFYGVLNLKHHYKFSLGIFLSLIVGLFGAMTSHYYAFLMAGIIGLCSLFYLDQWKKRFILMSSSVVSILLFLPFIHITLFQLTKTKGNWIPRPTSTWLFEFMTLYLNGSIVICILFFVFTSVLLLKMKRTSREAKFALAIFSIGFLMGFIISIQYTPVLRDMVMLFMLPFAFLFVFSQISLISIKTQKILFGTILIGSLVHTFFVYKLLEPIHYGEFKMIAQDINKRKSEDFTYLTISTQVDYLNYYLKSPIQETITDWSSSETVFEVKDCIENSTSANFAYQYCSDKHNPMYLSIIRKKYPFLKTSNGNLLWADYWFTKGSNNEKKTLLNQWLDTIRGYDSLEFFGGFTLKLNDLLKISKENYFLQVSTELEIERLNELQQSYYLVVTVNRDGQMLKNEKGEPRVYYAYDQSRLNNYTTKHKAFVSFDLPDGLKPSDELSVYLWNPNHLKMRYTGIKLMKIGRF